MSVPQDQPELHVDKDEEEGVEDGVGYSQAQSDVRRHGWAQCRQRQELVHRRWLLLRHRGRHGRLSLPGGRGERSGGERRGLTAGLSQLSHPGRGGESRSEKKGETGCQWGCQEVGERKSRGKKTRLTSCCRAGDRQSARHMISDENEAVVRGSGQEPSARTSPPAALRT